MLKINTQLLRHHFQTPLIAIAVSLISLGIIAHVAAIGYPFLAPAVTATPGNGNQYGVTVKWTRGAIEEASGIQASSLNAWRVGYALSGKSFTYVTLPASNSSLAIHQLTCGQLYKFNVYSEDSSGAESSPIGTASATPGCPTATVTSFTANGTTGVTAAWSATSWATSFTVYLSTNDGSFVAYTGITSTSKQFGASCNNSYRVKVSATAAGQTGPISAIKSVNAGACPVTPPPGGSSPSPGGSSSGGTTTTHTGSTSTPRSATKTGSAAASASGAPAQPPAAPTGFVATTESDKIVELSWNASTASAGIQDYILNRSTDNVNWTPLATTADTTYEDDATDFSTTYYYQIEAVDNSGNVSAYATTQITTNSFSGSSSKVTSDDKFVTVQIPSGAFDQQADCTVGSSNGNSTSLSSGQDSMLLGPYDLLCVGQDGSVIDSFNKPLPITMNLSQASAGFADFTVRTIDGSSTKTIKSSYNPQTKQISFTLTADESFAAFGVRQKSSAGAIVGIITGLLLLGLLVVGFLFLRRRMIAGSNPAIATAAVGSTAAEQFEQAVNKPNCTHLAMAHQVQPQSTVCEECKAAGREWKSLRICLTCGHVGCSDDSPGQDARHHFEQTGHPLIMAYNEPAAGNIGWCYIDQTYI